MWIERTPEVGEVVKVIWSNFMNERPSIGIFLGSHECDGSLVKVEFGEQIKFLDRNSNFFVYKK